MYCKNCKYFKRYTEENDSEYFKYNKKYGECNNNKFIYGSSSGTFGEKEALKSNDLLLYEDYESFSASFEVGENFGCVHFESKE